MHKCCSASVFTQIFSFRYICSWIFQFIFICIGRKQTDIFFIYFLLIVLLLIHGLFIFYVWSRHVDIDFIIYIYNPNYICYLQYFYCWFGAGPLDTCILVYHLFLNGGSIPVLTVGQITLTVFCMFCEVLKFLWLQLINFHL